jgi:hypothetical protein
VRVPGSGKLRTRIRTTLNLLLGYILLGRHFRATYSTPPSLRGDLILTLTLARDGWGNSAQPAAHGGRIEHVRVIHSTTYLVTPCCYIHTHPVLVQSSYESSEVNTDTHIHNGAGTATVVVTGSDGVLKWAGMQGTSHVRARVRSWSYVRGKTRKGQFSSLTQRASLTMERDGIRLLKILNSSLLLYRPRRHRSPRYYIHVPCSMPL